MALSAYRHLLRSTRIAFQGDSRLLHAARDKARQDFDALRTLAPESQEAKAGVAHAQEVARVLRTNVVQGVRVEEEKYQLRIHSETERGDNNTIKVARKPLADGLKSCCGEAR